MTHETLDALLAKVSEKMSDTFREKQSDYLNRGVYGQPDCIQPILSSVIGTAEDQLLKILPDISSLGLSSAEIRTRLGRFLENSRSKYLTKLVNAQDRRFSLDSANSFAPTKPILLRVEARLVSSRQELLEVGLQKRMRDVIDPDGHDPSSDKKVIFISHASQDRAVAELVKHEIEAVLGEQVKVFVSSVPGQIPPSSDWLEEIWSNLAQASALVALMTPVSVTRPWVWIEIGAAWWKMTNYREGKTDQEMRIYPCCVPPISLSDLLDPLSRLQSLSLGDTAHIEQFYNQLVSQFGCGSSNRAYPADLVTKLSKYNAVEAESGGTRISVSTPVEIQYTDEGLSTIIETSLFGGLSKMVARNPFAAPEIIRFHKV